MNRKKALLALGALLFPILLGAQGVLEVKRVPSDSLVRFMRGTLGSRIYFLKDAEDVAFYTIAASPDEFEVKALGELKSKGYAVTLYDGAWFVTSGRGLEVGDLPSGFFEVAPEQPDPDELARLNEEESVVATFKNKVYEIGENTGRTSGRAYVRGYVRDVATGEPLIGVSVLNSATGGYTVTDTYGFYRIGVPLGDQTLQFSGYSLEDMMLNLHVYGDGGLDVVMKEKVISLKGAVVSAEGRSAHRDARMGLEKIRIATIRKVPSAFGEPDVLKVVMTLPGVKSVGEASTGINVRGGSTDQNLILFNDGTIYNPSHMFGVLSAFNADVISDVELYKSSIPSEYGGRISSVLDIRGKEGNSNKVAGSVGLGILTSNFCLEGPLSKGRTTFVLGGRTTYSDWLLGLLPEDSNYAGGSASFSDLNLGITHKVNANNSLHAYGYWSRDRFGFSDDNIYHYNNLNASLKWRHQISERNIMTLTAGYDRFGNVLDDTAYEYGAYTYSSTINQGYAKLGFKTTSGSHTLSYGAQGIYYGVDPGSALPYGDGSTYVEKHLDGQSAVEASLYAGDAWQVGEKLSLDYGVRLATFTALSPSKFYWYPEVRLSGKYSFTPNLSVKAGFNSMSQAIHMISNNTSASPMDAWRLSSARLRPQTGWQLASGVYWTVADGNVDLSLEGYWKRTQHGIDYMSGAVLTMNQALEDFLVETRGKAYGIELMVKKTLGKLNGWISYTYSRTLLQETQDRGAETINGGAWYNAPHDKPHDFKAVLNYKFTHRYSLSVNIDYSTGRPVTIPIGKYQYANSTYLAYSDRNVYRIPDYFRMDVAMNVEPGHYLKQLAHMSVTFGVYNVTGRRNAYSVYYSANSKGSVEGHMLSVFAVPIPYLTLNLKF